MRSIVRVSSTSSRHAASMVRPLAAINVKAAAMASSTATPVRSLTDGVKKGPQKIVCALYEGGTAGKTNPAILGCVENELGLRSWLEGLGHKYAPYS